MDNGIILIQHCIAWDDAYVLAPYGKRSVPQRKKNEIRTVVIAVIAMIVFLLIWRESHFKYQHPSFLSGSGWSPAVVAPS
jgi:hypothetical protein